MRFLRQLFRAEDSTTDLYCLSADPIRCEAGCPIANVVHQAVSASRFMISAA